MSGPHLDCFHLVVDPESRDVYLLQTRPEKKHLAQFGLDLIKGEVRNNVQAGVLEPVLAKTKIIQVYVTLCICVQGVFWLIKHNQHP